MRRPGRVEDDDLELFPDWSAEFTRPPQVRTTVPWYRNLRVLSLLVAVAAVALVISTVLLLMLDRSADFRTGPRISTPRPQTPTSATAAVPSPDPPDTAGTPTTPGPDTPVSSESEPSSEAESGREAPAPDRPTARPDPDQDSDGPRTNVTRAPMSFTPAPAPRR